MVSKIAERDDDIKLEDILKSIRGVIDNYNHDEQDNASKDKLYPKSESAVLELTNVVLGESQKNGFLSEETKSKTKLELDKFAESVDKLDYSIKDSSLDTLVNNLMNPLIKEWLNNNLPRIVEKIVGDEIKKMIPKK